MSDMKREEEIKQEAYRRYCNDPSVTFNIQCFCFESGAKWADKTMIDKACEWLKKNIGNYQNWEYNEFHQCVEYDGSIDIEKIISDFREAMEEQLFMGWKYYPKEFSSYEEYVKYLKGKGLALEAPEEMYENKTK